MSPRHVNDPDGSVPCQRCNSASAKYVLVTTLHQRTSSPRWGMTFAYWCAGVSAFQGALAAGAPWGAASWGGGHDGVLPVGLRCASGVAALVFAGIAPVAAGKTLGSRWRRRVLLGTGVYVAVGTVANGLSPSPVERAIWLPLSVIGTALAVMAWRETARTATPSP